LEDLYSSIEIKKEKIKNKIHAQDAKVFLKWIVRILLG
jgi:hypothetical protein